MRATLAAITDIRAGSISSLLLMSRSERFLDLVQLLRRHRRPVSGPELARELSVSLRTVFKLSSPAARRSTAAAGVDCFENAIALLGGPRALAG